MHRIPFSTNVERVALAAGHKGLIVEWVDHEVADRTAIRSLSGQVLVPVMELDGEVVIDSMAIVERLERLVPERPLYPVDPAALARLGVFIEWFNEVWKVPPNLIAAEWEREQPDSELIERMGLRMLGWLPRFDDLLAEQDHLMGADFGAADVCAFPFLKFAAGRLEPADPEAFHRVLDQYMPLGVGFGRLRAWIDRVDSRPRA